MRVTRLLFCGSVGVFKEPMLLLDGGAAREVRVHFMRDSCGLLEMLEANRFSTRGKKGPGKEDRQGWVLNFDPT